MATLRTVTITLSIVLLTTTTVLAGGPPLITDDAGTVEVGKVELEINGASTHDQDTIAGSVTKTIRHEAEAKISTGLLSCLGVSLEIPYTFSSQTWEGSLQDRTAYGWGDLEFEFKYVFAELAGISFAIKPIVTAPTGRYDAGLSEGRWTFGTTLIASREFQDGTYAVHVNLGYDHHDYRTDEARETTRGNLWSGSVAGEMKVVQGLTGVLDLGLSTNTDNGSTLPPVYVLAGARYEINAHLDINAGVMVGLTAPEDDVSIRYGVVLKF